ncbi:MAG TPA: helix-turn-helix domain-containing protein [Tepidisphaeraceae bacterium]|jgi:sugar-specific transcriptional regulator TrmB|nr:helix-turn-helix domain-containing protein [Tepidisphaeraceae bacterium]
MNTEKQAIAMLGELGFSELEGAIYAFLLQESPATGYRIAQALNKPVANTYKGLGALAAKGAVIIDDGETRLCRAVPPLEVFGQMERVLSQRCQQAAQMLSKLKSAPEDERVYRLQSVGQVMQRARQMISSAKQVVLVSAYPAPLKEIREELETAAARGVGIVLKIYEEAQVKGAQIVMSNEATAMMEQFPAQELNLVSDAQEHLVALLDGEGSRLIQGVWSSSLFLSFVQYNGLYSEWLLTKTNSQIKMGASPETLKKTLKRSFPLMETPGYHRLRRELNGK